MTHAVARSSSPAALLSISSAGTSTPLAVCTGAQHSAVHAHVISTDLADFPCLPHQSGWQQHAHELPTRSASATSASTHVLRESQELPQHLQPLQSPLGHCYASHMHSDAACDTSAHNDGTRMLGATDNSDGWQPWGAPGSSAANGKHAPMAQVHDADVGNGYSWQVELPAQAALPHQRCLQHGHSLGSHGQLCVDNVERLKAELRKEMSVEMEERLQAMMTRVSQQSAPAATGALAASPHAFAQPPPLAARLPVTTTPLQDYRWQSEHKSVEQRDNGSRIGPGNAWNEVASAQNKDVDWGWSPLTGLGSEGGWQGLAGSPDAGSAHIDSILRHAVDDDSVSAQQAQVGNAHHLHSAASNYGALQPNMGCHDHVASTGASQGQFIDRQLFQRGLRAGSGHAREGRTILHGSGCWGPCADPEAEPEWAMPMTSGAQAVGTLSHGRFTMSRS